jgi:hypothetical protein
VLWQQIVAPIPARSRAVALVLAVAIVGTGCNDASPVEPAELTAPSTSLLEMTAASSSGDEVYWNGNTLSYTDNGSHFLWVRDQQHAQHVTIYQDGALQAVVEVTDVHGEPVHVRISNPAGDVWFIVDRDGNLLGSSEGCVDGICAQSSGDCNDFLYNALGAAGVAGGAFFVAGTAGLISLRVPPAWGFARSSATVGYGSLVVALQQALAYRFCRQMHGGGRGGSGGNPETPIMM